MNENKIEIAVDKKCAKELASLHINTFKGFFLTFLGKGFLKCLYKGFITHEDSNVLIAREGDKIVGLLAYSKDLSKFYKYLLKKSFFPFCWYSFIAFLKKPKIFFRLLGALKKDKESLREEKYVELSSICVDEKEGNKGIGTELINYLKSLDFTDYKYIKLETDAINNDKANAFYVKNNFVLYKTYSVKGNRLMNEYRYNLL